jgi:hypothetical protein
MICFSCWLVQVRGVLTMFCEQVCKLLHAQLAASKVAWFCAMYSHFEHEMCLQPYTSLLPRLAALSRSALQLSQLLL